MSEETTFTDTLGRQWTISMDDAAMQAMLDAVAEIAGEQFDELDKRLTLLLAGMTRDGDRDLATILGAILADDIEAAGLSEEEFLDAFDHDTIFGAGQALLGALINRNDDILRRIRMNRLAYRAALIDCAN